MPRLGLDDQKLDTRPDTPGNAAMDADAQFSSGGVVGKSSEARGKDSRLNLGGLPLCRRTDYRDGNAAGRGGEVSRGRSSRRASPRPIPSLLADEGPNSLVQGTVWKDSMGVKRQQGSPYPRGVSRRGTNAHLTKRVGHHWA